MKKSKLNLAIVIMLTVFLFACETVSTPDDLKNDANPDENNDTDPSTDITATDCVEILTSHGIVVIELNSTSAPQTVSNFLGYVNSGFYSATVFHRIYTPGDSALVQGGGYMLNNNNDLIKKTTGAAITNESDNGLLNDRASIAMARLPEPHTATSEFYINVTDNNGLDYQKRTNGDVIWGYAVFGKVTSGMNVIDSMSLAEVNGTGTNLNSERPKINIILQKATAINCS